MNPPVRYIAHFDLDAFFVSVERILNPNLIGKPIIVGGHSKRAVVSACSYEARTYGVQSAMPMHQALSRCPQAIVVQGNYKNYTYYSQLVSNLLATNAPVMQKSSIDEFYLDLTGMDTYHNIYPYTAQLKQQIISETQLPVSFALASNKLISKIATNEAKPNGEIQIPHGTEAAFLAPLPIEKMPMIGNHTAMALHTLGIQTIGQLAAFPCAYLEKIFGKNGKQLWHKSNGIDDSEVIPTHRQKSISAENTFQNDTANATYLQKQIFKQVDKICKQLRIQNKETSSISIKIRYTNFQTVSKQAIIPPTAFDHIITPIAQALFNQLFNPTFSVRLIGVKCGNLSTAYNQTSLFQQKDSNQSMLYKIIDDVKNKYGNSIIQKANQVNAIKNE